MGDADQADEGLLHVGRKSKLDEKAEVVQAGLDVKLIRHIPLQRFELLGGRAGPGQPFPAGLEELPGFDLGVGLDIAVEDIDRQDLIPGELPTDFGRFRVLDGQVGGGRDVGRGDRPFLGHGQGARGKVRNEVSQDQDEQERLDKGIVDQRLEPRGFFRFGAGQGSMVLRRRGGPALK